MILIRCQGIRGRYDVNGNTPLLCHELTFKIFWYFINVTEQISKNQNEHKSMVHS
jgi:hypothetical protein